MIKFLTLAALFLGAFGTGARAETTEWIYGGSLYWNTPKIPHDGLQPTSIECKDSGKKNLNMDAAYIRFGMSPKPAGTHWHWWVTWSADGERDMHEEMSTRRLHLVSKSGFTRKYGTRVNCYLYRD